MLAEVYRITMTDPSGTHEVASGDVMVVHTEKLVERRAWKVNGGEVAVMILEAMGHAGIVDVKSDRCTNVVNPDHLGLDGVRKVLVSEGTVPKREALVHYRPVVASDGERVVDAQELRKGIACKVDRGERKGPLMCRSSGCRNTVTVCVSFVQAPLGASAEVNVGQARAV